MHLAVGALVALCGAGLGFGAGRLFKRPALQGVVACVAAWALASLVATVLWLVRPPVDAEVLAVAWHLPRLLVALAVVGAVAWVAHAVLCAAAAAFPASLTWRPILLALAGALAGFWGYPGGSGLGEPLR